ncbi:universal stress protein [Paractinoplanes durhamensis]|uniref:Universal stress protein n=1 Tax=Paractinoplanes durhamensis TaxID=113563 RepID=A0ABQ3YUT0_9ACTN|nr:universal stress protein [Actinoplanes durhamensis]GIE01351.1 universal stress protein [Actinoplanes durhamensis]
MSGKKIIIGYDRSADSKAAAAWALDEAGRTGAPVEFFFAYEWPTWAPANSTIAAPPVWPGGETDRAVNGMLNEAVATARLTHPEVSTSISIERASAAGTLIERSAEAGLIVLGSRGHSAVTGLLGSVSVAVSAQAACPVIVVRGDQQPAAPIVVGVDDSPSAQAALAFAAELAAARNVPLRVIHARPPVTSPWDFTPGEAAFDAADNPLAGWAEKYPQVEFVAEAVTEHPAAALAAASTTAQLLVVGTRGRGAVRGMLLGSVSQHALRHSACTVAVAHS